MKKEYVLIGFTSLVILLLLFGVFFWVSVNNQEIKLRSKIEAQKEVCEAYYDKLWKVISQKAQVTEQYKEAFKDIYPQLIEGRYANDGGSLMKWIVESNPDFDTSLYKDLMSSIEAERAGFFMEQKKLTDLANQHRIIKQTFPNSLIVGNRPDIEIMIVSSTITKKVMESGIDDDVEIFKR
jgi:hypothetical protein